MMTLTRNTTLFLLSSALSGTALGAGFALNEQNASGLGQAFAGRASDAIDASVVYGNPGAMSRFDRAQVSGGFAVVNAYTDIDNAQGTFAGTNKGDMVPTVVVPYAYYVQPLNEQWSVGFGLYSPFGLLTDYERNFQGRYFGTKSEVVLITAQPTVSFKFNEHFSIGAGVTYNRIEGELSKDSPNPIPGGGDIVAKVTGDDTAWGYNVGMLFQLDDKTRFGLTYHSKVDYTLEGHTKISNHPLLGSPRYKASLDVTLPEMIDFSVTQQLAPGLNLHLGAARTGWSSFDELVIENRGAPASLATSVETENWHDTWTYSVGMSYQLNPQWLLRGGIARDESPIPNSHRTVRIPSDDRMIFALGASWNISEQLSADLAYSYLHESKASINQVAAQGYSYSADYKNDAHIFGVQLNWKL